MSKGEGNKRERKRNKKPPKSKAGASAAAKAKAGGGNSSMEQPNSSFDDEEDLSGTDEDVCIDPSLIHQPTPGPPGRAYSAQHAQQHANYSAQIASRAGHGQLSASKRARTEGHPYPSSRSRMREAMEREHESENDSNTNSSIGRSATSTPFDDAYDGANVGVNNIVSGINNMNNSNNSVAANSTSAIRPVGRQLSAVPGYFPGPIPASLNEFHLNYGVGVPMSAPGGSRNASAPPMHSVNAPNGAPSQPNTRPNPPVHHQSQQSFTGPAMQAPSNNSSGGPSQAQPSRSTSQTTSSGGGGGGFAAHAYRAVSFSAAAAASAGGGAQLPFGQASREDIEIVHVGGGLPVARRVSNARATRRMGN